MDYFDLDTTEVLSVVQTNKDRLISSLRKRGGVEKNLNKGWHEFRSRSKLDTNDLKSIACDLKHIWSYETPEEIAYRNQVTKIDAENRKREKARSEFFPKKRSSPSEPIFLYPEPPIIYPLPPAPTVDSGLFESASDVEQNLILLDGDYMKSVGGMGVLQGVAESLSHKLTELAEKNMEQNKNP